MENNSEPFTSTMNLPTLLTDQCDLFVGVLEFLGVKDHGRLGCLNTQFRDELGENHPAWAQIAANILGMSAPKPNQGTQFNWKSAVRLFFITNPMTLKDSLLGLIQNVAIGKTKPCVECGGSIKAAQPELFIPAAGVKLDLPLDPTKLQKLIDDGICERAPFGRGTETVVDLETRKCWRLMLGKDVIQLNDEFAQLLNQSSPGMDPDSPLYKVKDKMMPHLFGDGEICAQPYSMLIYDEGSFFSNHRDTLRGPNHFGSLVVSLPVGCDSEGGELVLTSFSSGTEASGRPTAAEDSSAKETASKKLKTEIIHNRPTSRESCKFHAFFTDVYHEVKPVTKGYRVALTFHLWALPTVGIPRSVSSTLNIDLATMLLRRVLETFFESTGTKCRFVIALDHSYSSYTLDEWNLRGRDRILYDIMDAAKGDSELFDFELEELSVQRFAKPKNCKKYRDLQVLGEGYEGGEEPDEELSYKTVWVNQEHFLAMEHETTEYEYNTGNEGYRTELKYEDACMIIKHPDF